MSEKFQITRAENRNLIEDGKVELESTVSMTLQQKSVLHDAQSVKATASTSVSSSGIQTPKVSSSIRFDDTTSPIRGEGSNNTSVEAFEASAPSLPIEVWYKTKVKKLL